MWWFWYKRALDVLNTQKISKVHTDGPEITHHSLLIDKNRYFPSDNPESLGWLGTIFLQFQLPEGLFENCFVLCYTNEVVAKLYTSLCSFINNRNAINYLFNLLIWELLSSVQIEVGVCEKQCDKFKVLENLIEACFLDKLFVCFVEELASCLVFRGEAQCFRWTQHFQTEESCVAFFLFSSSCIIS